MFGLRANRPLRTNAVASNSPIRRRISASLKWSKRVGSKGDVAAGRGFPDAIGADAVMKGVFIAMNVLCSVHVAPPLVDDHTAQRTFGAPNVRSPRICLGHKPGLGRSEPQIAPPASVAGRGVAKRRRDRRAEVRRLPPSRAHSTNAAPHRTKTLGNSQGAASKPKRDRLHARGRIAEFRCRDSSQSGPLRARS